MDSASLSFHSILSYHSNQGFWNITSSQEKSKRLTFLTHACRDSRLRNCISKASCRGHKEKLYSTLFPSQRTKQLKARKSTIAFRVAPDSSGLDSIDISSIDERIDREDSKVESLDEEPKSGEASSVWDRVPYRYKVIVTTSLAFVICNMDKVNLSVAIIPMSDKLDWSASTAGLVQSSFFWGYALSQVPGGWLARRFTGEVVLGAGVLMWSLATAAVPLVASYMPGLLFCRLMVGLGEGVSPSAATDLIARTVPKTERSRAVAFVFNGLSVGSIVGLLLAPVLIERFGWESVFYAFGVLGALWCIGFTFVSEKGKPQEILEKEEDKVIEQPTCKTAKGQAHQRILGAHDASKEMHLNAHSGASHTTISGRVPWKAIFKSPAVWAMIYVHFCGNWGHYCYLSWLPSYLSEELNLDLTNAALVSIFPPLGSMLMSGIAALMADYLISNGVDTTFVRKLCQTIAFLSPATCMTLATLNIGLSPWVTVSIISSGLALSSFALGGLYCTHQDISPKYASVLLGITNTAGAIPGILGVYLTGYLLDQTHSWNMALFAPSIVFWITGTVVWNAFASSEPQSFDN